MKAALRYLIATAKDDVRLFVALFVAAVTGPFCAMYKVAKDFNRSHPLR